MGILSKNLLNSLSNLRYAINTPSLYTPKRHHIFKTAAAASENKCSKHRLLVRRLRFGLDENHYFSDLSHGGLTSALSRISEGFRSYNRFFCGSCRSYFSYLSSEDLSPMKSLEFPSFDDYTFLGSYGGVVCLDNNHEGALFWNPSTNEVKFLPPSEVDRPDPAAELSRTIVTYTFFRGFGYDSKSQDYKYLRLVSIFFEEEETGLCENSCHQIELYSLKNDSWKHIPYTRETGLPCDSACVNGDFYWFTVSVSPTEILKFDFATEKFSFVPFPPTGKPIGHPSYFTTPHTYRAHLFEFGGSLSVIIYSREFKLGAEKSIELWVWNGGWWTREFDHCFPGAHKPLGFSKNGELLFLVGGVDRQLLAYDVGTKELKKKVDVYCNPYEFYVIPYVESMAQLSGESAQGMEI